MILLFTEMIMDVTHRETEGDNVILSNLDLNSITNRAAVSSKGVVSFHSSGFNGIITHRSLLFKAPVRSCCLITKQDERISLYNL